MVEEALNSMKKIVELYLNTQLAKQDVHYADGLFLEPMAQVLLGDDLPNEKGWPGVAIKCDGISQTLYMTSKKDVTYNLSIGIIVNDTDDKRAQKRLWRTMRAVESTFEIHCAGFDGIIDYKTDSMDFSASVFGIDDQKSTLKGGIIGASIVKRLDAYNVTQV